MLAPSPQTAIALAALALLAATPARASVEISSAPTQNMSCSAGVCTPTAKSAVLNVNDLTAMLSSTDITVKSGNSAVTIGIVSPFAWASTHRLTLDANLNVNIKAQVMVEGTAGLTIVTNDGGSGGDLIFYPGGKIDFWDMSSSLIVNGNSFTLVSNIASLAKHVANHRSGLYAFANDYDAAADGMYSDFPVATKFSGTFEGLGHAISNLNVSPSGYATAALFVEATGTLRDVALHDVLIATTGSAGSLLLLADGATIIGCDATGYVIGEGGAAGGLVAESSDAGATIIRSHSAASVTGASGVAGGLIGSSSGANISLSYAAGRANARTAGGLVGYMSGGSILSSYASGHASGEDYGGGLVGQMYATAISQSFATGEVTGYNAGGLVGFGTGSIQRFLRQRWRTQLQTWAVRWPFRAGGQLDRSLILLNRTREIQI